MRQHPIFIANWKMHKGPREGVDFVEELIPHIDAKKHWIGIAPSFPVMPSLVSAAQGSQLFIGAQTLSEHESGAYTGEVAGSMIKEVGATFVLIGHSERRTLFHESDQLIHRKLQMAIRVGLLPVLCVGETMEERERGETEMVLERQLSVALSSMKGAPLVIAYEPVWAIGTGRVATPEMAQETHADCRAILAHLLGDSAAQKTPILYGGSVKPDNAKDLLARADIDGALIGGASLDVHSFIKIFQSKA